MCAAPFGDTAHPTPIPVCPDGEVTWESKSQSVLVAFSLFSLTFLS